MHRLLLSIPVLVDLSEAGFLLCNTNYKIEEAQKELTEPQGHDQKGRNESSGKVSDSIKGLKRKKIVTENQLKKIPKSPIKKPSQIKKSASSTECTLPKEATPASLFSKSKSYTFRSAQDSKDGMQKTLADTAIKVESKDLTLVHQKGNDKSCTIQSMQSKSGSEKITNKGTCALHTAAPLEVLLKAMEPDFNTLTRKKTCSPIGQLGKATSVPVTQSDGFINMPSVHFGLQSQPAVLASYTPSKPPFYNSASTGVLSTDHHSSQEHPIKEVNCQHDKPGLQKSFSAGPSFNLSYAPVPSGSSGLPQSQPPIVQTCQSLSATVPNPIQVPVTPGFKPVQVATVVNFGVNQMCDVATKEQKTKKQGKYVCEYCNRACAKPSVLLKHIRSHTGERPYPCVTCGFSFKTKSNLYKHKKSHAHAIKLGLISKDSGSMSLSQEGTCTNSDVEESGESDEEVNTAYLDHESSQSSLPVLSESSLHSSGTVPGSHEDADHSVINENNKPLSSQRGCEPKVTAALPKVVVYPVNVSPLRADSPRGTDSNPEQAAAQRQRDFQTASLRSSITVLSSLKEVDCTSPLPDFIGEDENQQCKSPPGSGHAQLQRQQATDYSQQTQGKCLLSPRSLGSTDSGYFSRSESADQAISPPSPFVKITPPTESDLKNTQVSTSSVVATVMHVANSKKPPVLPGHVRPPLETKALSLEERITKLISENEAVVDAKQLDSVKPRRTSLSRRGSIDSPKSYIFKDSFQFDLKPVVRRSSSNSDIPKSPFTPTDQSKPIFLLSVPPQYPTMDCLPITRSNSVPTTPGRSAVLPNSTPQPHPLRICQSFDEKISSVNDDVFSPAPSTPNQAVHRTLVRQIAVEDFSTNEGHVLLTVHSMDENHYRSSITHEIRSKSFDHAPEKARKSQQGKGTIYECETCRNRYRKLENFENHKKFYCSELHGPKNKIVPVRDVETDVFASGTQQPVLSRNNITPGIVDQPMIRKRRKMKSVGDDEDQSPTETPPPCSRSFDSCQMPIGFSGNSYNQHTHSSSIPPTLGQIQLIARGIEEARLSPIREIHISTCSKERAELQRQGSGTSVIRHTNSLSRPNSFEISESIDRSSPVDFVESDANISVKRHVESKMTASLKSYHERNSIHKCPNQGKIEPEKQTLSVTSESSTSSQSRLVRQNNIQVPEILVTEEPDREHESQNESQKPVDADYVRNFVPKYQLQHPAVKTGQAHSFISVQGAQMSLPVITIPNANEFIVSTFNNKNKKLPSDPGVETASQSFSELAVVPQILITHEHTLPPSTVESRVNLSEININAKIGSDRQNGRSTGTVGSQIKNIVPAVMQNHIGEIQSSSSPGSLHCAQKLASVSLCPQQEPAASSKRMLSPANSLDIAMEKTQKRAKDEHGAACLTDGRSLSYLNSKMSELTRQRKLMLVRQICTTEPVDSPIETDAPEQLPEFSDPEKNDQIEVCHAKHKVVQQEMENKTSTTTVAGSHTHSFPMMQRIPGPGNTTFKSQERPDEHQWSPAKSHVRPPAFLGQIKLAASVSVVNTRDSHRLSFPSLKTATTFTWCFLLKRKPLHVEQTDQRISAYSTWTVKPKNPNPLGLPTKVVMSLFDSKQISKKILYTQAITTSLKSDILTYSGKLKDVLPKVLAKQNTLNDNCGKAKPESQSGYEADSSKAEPRRVKIFDGGYKSNEEYVYVRGRGRGKYICEECGIRCKKPSMLRKHIRTHSDVRPYHCAQCNFSFKTKGNLTKHMKSKAHSKKCMEMGVAIGVIEDHDTEDSVSASPQHLPSSQADLAPSSLLAQMSISPNPNPTSLLQIPGSMPQALDADSVAIGSSVLSVRQMSSSAVFSSHDPNPSLFSSYPAPTSESNSSDTESVHMMSPVSPCRQMSIDYPDPDVPPSPPMPSKNFLSGQDESTSSNSQCTTESNTNVDRSTQTTSDSLQGSLHFSSLGPDYESGTGATTRLFSHLPLHSQQPTRSPQSMVPVGGIQLVPAGLAAYSTFVPIQAGPVQLTIPAVSVIHRQVNSPLPVSNTSPQPQGSPCQPLVVQESINSVLPCFPLGQVAGLQTLSAPQATLQPVGMETLSVVGLANSTQLVPQQNLAALGVQVLAASPVPQSSVGSPGQIPGLQILNIALPALIPSLSSLSALSPLVPDKPSSPEGLTSASPNTQVAESSPAASPSGSFPTSWPAATPVAVVPVAVKPLVEVTSPSKPSRSGNDTRKGSENTRKASVEVGEARLPRQPITRQPVIDDYNNGSSDDEDRLVIAT
ncbi:Zinc finger protein 40 [Bagarius yarrelli]|uniref:Zinc finger protein 40 n=1 Tax=Bagarius yarrelli TaxID=175774 RepID=A0A556VU03_BAGYA|nr:Zinc finger protein 40 [Bagarius yarrelli]